MDTRDNPKFREFLYGVRGNKQHRYTYPHVSYSDFLSRVQSMYVPASHKIR